MNRKDEPKMKPDAGERRPDGDEHLTGGDERAPAGGEALEPMSDRDFAAALDAIERGAAPPQGLDRETADDLALARRLFDQRVPAVDVLAGRGLPATAAPWSMDDMDARSAEDGGADEVEGREGGRSSGGSGRSDGAGGPGAQARPARRLGLPTGRLGLPAGRRWMAEAAILLLALGLGALVVTQGPRTGRGDAAEPASPEAALGLPATPDHSAGAEEAPTSAPGSAPVAPAATALAPGLDPAGPGGPAGPGNPGSPALPPGADQGGAGDYRISDWRAYDPQRGRLVAVGRLGLEERTLVIDAGDGRLLADWAPLDGPLAVDGARNTAVADGASGVATLNLATGARGEIRWPSEIAPLVGTEPRVAPIVNPKTGEILVFRGDRMLILPADAGRDARPRLLDFEVLGKGGAHDGQRRPVAGAVLDPDRGTLYLDFATYTSTPWFGHTIVAYDLASGRELGRGSGRSFFQAVAQDGALLGASWDRMGVGQVFRWKDGKPGFGSGDWGGAPKGVALESDGEAFYVATEDELRRFDPGTLTLHSVMPLPFHLDPAAPANAIAGHHAASDRLLFVVDGRLAWLPVDAIRMPQAVAPTAENPPRLPVRALALAPRWPADPTVFGIWETGELAPPCGAFGQKGGLLFLSRDGGGTWQRALGNLGALCDRVSAVAALPGTAPDRPWTLLAGVPGLGSFRSEDGGAWWSPSGGGLASAGVAELRGSAGATGPLFAAGPLGELSVAAAGDEGRVWRDLGQSLPVFDLSPDYASDRTLMGVGHAAAGGSELRISKDGGNTWNRLGPVPDWTDPSRGIGVEMLSLAPLFSRWGVAFLYHRDGALYRSADGGQTWSKVLDGLDRATVRPRILYGPDEANRAVHLLTVSSAQPGLSPPDDRLRHFRSDDGGQTWMELEVVQGPGAATALAPAPDFASSGRLLVGTIDGRVEDRTLPLR